MDSWKSFQVMWRLFKANTDASEEECSLQLIQCCDKKFLGQLFRADYRILSKPEIEQLNAIRKLAVGPVAMNTAHSEAPKTPQKSRPLSQASVQDKTAKGQRSSKGAKTRHKK